MVDGGSTPLGLEVISQKRDNPSLDFSMQGPLNLTQNRDSNKTVSNPKPKSTYLVVTNSITGFAGNNHMRSYKSCLVKRIYFQDENGTYFLDKLVFEKNSEVLTKINAKSTPFFLRTLISRFSLKFEDPS